MGGQVEDQHIGIVACCDLKHILGIRPLIAAIRAA
jgi:hypothetical protein